MDFQSDASGPPQRISKHFFAKIIFLRIAHPLEKNEAPAETSIIDALHETSAIQNLWIVVLSGALISHILRHERIFPTSNLEVSDMENIL